MHWILHDWRGDVHDENGAYKNLIDEEFRPAAPKCRLHVEVISMSAFEVVQSSSGHFNGSVV